MFFTRNLIDFVFYFDFLRNIQFINLLSPLLKLAWGNFKNLLINILRPNPSITADILGGSGTWVGILKHVMVIHK